MSRDRGYRVAITFILLLALGLLSVPAGLADVSSAASASSSPPGWLQTGPLPQAVQYLPLPVVKLDDGRILVGPIDDGTGATTGRASIYDPVTNSWTQTGPMKFTNGYEAPVVLDNGNVLFTGGLIGYEYTPSSSQTTNACQLYDPATNRWKSVAPMLQSHSGHTATLLNDGAILVVGGETLSGPGEAGYFPTSDAERYDPKTNTWTTVSAEIVPRETQSVVLLHNGQVMAVGGTSSSPLASAELFDPQTDRWSPSAPMATPREDATATVLADGRVLVVGGADNDSTAQPLASTEIYDPATNSWSDGPSMMTPRKDQAAVLLPNGKVLVSGGVGPERPDDGDLSLKSAEIYDPAANSWSKAPDLPAAIGFPSAVPLADGSIQTLVLGATNLNGAQSRGLLFTFHLPSPIERQLPPGGPLPANRVYFAQTGHYLANGFLAYWQHFGGLAVFGYPISEEFQQHGVTVQYFERARFEWHPGSNPARYDVELGLLGDQAARVQGLLTTAPFQPVEATSDANCTFDAVTDHRLCSGFRAYWQAHGGLTIFGRPISEEFRDPATGLTVQYFERAVFEYHPNNPAKYQVLLRRLGTDALAGK